MTIDIEGLKKTLLKEIEKVVESVLTEYLEKQNQKIKNIVDFININSTKYKIVISPTKQKDKIVVYLYKAGRKLDVVGEIVLYKGEIKFYPYVNKIKKIAYYEKKVPDDYIEKIEEIVRKHINTIENWINEGFSIKQIEEEVVEEELPEDIGERIKRIEEEMKIYLKEKKKEYVPESYLNYLLKKYKVNKADFIRFVTEFYEKEKGKWYPIL